MIKNIIKYLTIVSLLFINCTYSAKYNLAIINSEKYIDGVKHYDRINDNHFDYSDSSIGISADPVKCGFNISVFNKTDFDIKIIWDEAAYVDMYNRSNEVAPSDQRGITSDLVHTPSVVARKSNFKTNIIIAGDIYDYYDSRFFEDRLWDLYPYTESFYSWVKNETISYAKKTLSNKFKISIPIVINNVKTIYTITFAPDNLFIVRENWFGIHKATPLN